MSNLNVELVFGSLLHDIGKAIQRANNQRKPHSQLGKQFLNEYIENKNILDMVAYHHAAELKQANLAANNPAYIVYFADNIASGLDRRKKAEIDEVTYREWDTYTNQADIFNVFYIKDKGNKNRYYQPKMLDDRHDIELADENKKKFTPGDYAGIVERLKMQLSHLKIERTHINSLLNLLEATLSYVPSSTNLEEVEDISLFDHSRMTAAISSSIYHYLEEKKINDYREILFNQSSKLYQEKIFRMVSFDISGIQDFIYTIRDAKAAKMLRSRSFYLEILAEHLIEQLLEQLDLSRANVIYSGGGHAYIIAANTDKTVQVLREVEKQINQFLIDEFGANLFIALASVEFSGNALFEGQEQAYQSIYQELSRMLSDKKLARYDAESIRNLNEKGKKVGRECPVCHKIDVNSDYNHCCLCEGLIQLSSHLQKDDFIYISEDSTGLPIGFGKYLSTIRNEEHAKSMTDGLLYAKNKFYFGDNQNIHLWMGDYTSGKTFNEFAEDANGIQRLAVVRCDVDNLGQAFIGGYADRYATLSRTATFSRMMSLFFKYHINHVLEKQSSDATIIYAGGDDVFIVGEWRDMIEFAIQLREEFKKFTQEKLTLSAGIGIFPAKTPISIMASQTGELESAAKEIDEDKDGIALFTKENVFKWDTFIGNIWQDKFPFIQQYMKESDLSDEVGKGFIYRLLELLRNRVEEGTKTKGAYKTINWAHWVYYLARMEPRDETKKESFRYFAYQLNQYFESVQESKELILALELYIYSIRGEVK